MYIYMHRPCPWFVASVGTASVFLWPCSDVLSSFRNFPAGLPGWLSPGLAHPGNVSRSTSHHPDYIIKINVFLSFCQGKTSFSGGKLLFLDTIPISSPQSRRPILIFLALRQEYHCPPLQDTLCLGHRFHQTHRCGSTQGFPRGEAGKNRLSRDDF